MVSADSYYNMELIHIDTTRAVAVIIATVVPILGVITACVISAVIVTPIVAITERIVDHEKTINRYSGFRSTLRPFARIG